MRIRTRALPWPAHSCRCRTRSQLTKNSVKHPPLCSVGTRKEANAAAIVPICHPVDGVDGLLLFSLPQSVGNENLIPPETNDHILLKHLTTAGVLITIASTIPPRRPHNLQYHAHGADSGGRSLQWGERSPSSQPLALPLLVLPASMLCQVERHPPAGALPPYGQRHRTSHTPPTPMDYWHRCARCTARTQADSSPW